MLQRAESRGDWISLNKAVRYKELKYKRQSQSNDAESTLQLTKFEILISSFINTTAELLLCFKSYTVVWKRGFWEDNVHTNVPAPSLISNY